jgi:membrane protease YdiL (CAAX protease family)
MADPHPSEDSRRLLGLAAVVALFFYLLWPQLSLLLVVGSGLADRLYGPSVSERLTAKGGAADESTDDEAARRILGIRCNLWAGLIAFPLQAISMPWVLYHVAAIRPSRIGLTQQRLRRNMLIGVVAWIVVTPVVLGLNIFVEHAIRSSRPDTIQEHPLTLLAKAQPTGTEWALLVFSAVVAAPVLEETLYRGILQSTFVSYRNGGAIAMAAAFGVATLPRSRLVEQAWQQEAADLLRALMPGLFVLALVPVFIIISRRSARPEAAALFGTATLFAAAHSAYWPSPVALLVLGLALGLLAARTGSLVGPMVLHGLFNGVSCALLLMGFR